MKIFRSVATVIMTVCTFSANAIQIYNSGSTWTQGVCSLRFDVDGETSSVQNLKISVDVFDKHNKKIGSDIISTENFGTSDADRYTNAFIENEMYCEEDLSIKIKKATAIVDGKSTDLLKDKMIQVIDFKPIKINF